MNFFANTGAVALSIRAAREDDLDRIVEIHSSCYPDDRDGGRRRLNFQQNPLGTLGDLRVAEQGGRVVAHGFGFPLGVWFGGTSVPSVGIASIGVAPEARGAGVGRALVAHLEAEARARGAVLAVLHPFRYAFYRTLGYADVSPNRRLRVDPRAVPRDWVESARHASLRAATGDDVARLGELHRRSARRTTGWLERPGALWTRILTNERVHVVVLGDAGYVAFELLQTAPHARTTLDVRELVADHPEARRTLWGFLGMQAGQVAELEIEVSDDDPITFALTDADGGRFGDATVEHALGIVVAGPMVRVLDVGGALAARGWSRDGQLSLAVDDVAYRLVVRDGRAAVRREGSAALRLDARTLASVAFGGLRVRDAVALGLAHGDDADGMLAGPPFHTLDRF